MNSQTALPNPSSRAHTPRLQLNVRHVLCLSSYSPGLFTDHILLSIVPTVVNAAQDSIAKEVAAIQTLSETASKYPYYRFNYAWTRTVQDAVRILEPRSFQTV